MFPGAGIVCLIEPQSAGWTNQSHSLKKPSILYQLFYAQGMRTPDSTNPCIFYIRKEKYSPFAAAASPPPSFSGEVETFDQYKNETTKTPITNHLQPLNSFWAPLISLRGPINSPDF